MKPLTITATDRDNTRTLAIAGEIDLATSTQFATALAHALTPGATVVLDLTKVTFMDAQGLRVLLATRHHPATSTTPLALIPSPAVTRILDITGAARHLHLYHPAAHHTAGADDPPSCIRSTA